MVADEQRHRNAWPLIKRVDRRDHDPVSDGSPTWNEIGRQQHAIECADPPVLEHVASRFSASSSSVLRLPSDVTPLNCDRQFKPFIYLNIGAAPRHASARYRAARTRAR